jgi:hypothetical protein
VTTPQIIFWLIRVAHHLANQTVAVFNLVAQHARYAPVLLP